jgi:RNA polymerase sigma-70 factor (ECF subfamily)
MVEKIIINEKTLIELARGGDASSFSALVQEYQERAIHTAYAMIGNFEDARDVAQDSFVKAYSQLGSFKEQSKFYTWFYRILANTCKDFLRKKKIRQVISFWVGGRDEEGEAADAVAQVRSAGKTAPEELIDRELGAQIREALEKLPFRQRSVFGLRYLEGLSLEEIAQDLGISVGAVKANLWQAGEKMRKNLKGAHP